jgi:hypothetical protein
VTSQRRTTRTNNREFGDQEIALVLSLAGDPAAVATIDTISADLEARRPLTNHRGGGTRGMSNPDPRGNRRTVTISLCRFDGGKGDRPADFERPDFLSGWQNEHSDGGIDACRADGAIRVCPSKARTI